MKTFFEEVKKSFSSKEWYKEIIEGKVHFKLGYPAKLALISSIIVTIFFGVFIYKDVIPKAKAFILEAIPGDVVLTFKSGELSINKPVPYALPLPEEERKEVGKKNMLVIDTSREATLMSTKTHDTVVFASKHMIIGEKETGEIRAFSLKEVPDYVFTRDKAIDLFEMVSSRVWVLLLFVIVLLTLVFLLQMLIGFLLAGTLLWIVLKVAKRPAHWKNAFVAIVYAYTIIFAADIVLTIAGFSSIRFGHAVIITTIVASLFIFMNKKDEMLTPPTEVS